MRTEIQKSSIPQIHENIHSAQWNRASHFYSWKSFLHSGSSYIKPWYYFQHKICVSYDLSEDITEIQSALSGQIPNYWRLYVHINKMPEQLEATKRITQQLASIRYSNRDAIDRLLGNEGKGVLKKVVDLLNQTAHKQNWPIKYIDIQFIEDTDINNWQYILVVLRFDCDLDTADDYLHEFYNRLDILIDSFEENQESILTSLLYFDVGTALSTYRTN